MKETMIDKRAKTDFPIINEIAERWSSRAYDKMPVEREKIYSMLEAARWSASAFNEQPWKFLIVERSSEKFTDAVECLAGFNSGWAQNSGALIIALAKTHYSHNGTENRYSLYDLGQAVANLSTQAAALSLYLHQMAGFSAEKVYERFSIPEGFIPGVIISVGTIGSGEDLSPELKQREEEERKRKSLDDISVFL